MASSNWCSICSDPQRREYVNRQLAQGLTYNAIEVRSRTQGAQEAGLKPIKSETVKRHVTVCLANVPAGNTARTPAVMEVARLSAKQDIGEGGDDIARMVQKRTAEMLRDPDSNMRMTVRDGLAAQSLLDRREEKRKDRELAHAVARAMLAHLGPPAHLIEGHAVRVEE